MIAADDATAAAGSVLFFSRPRCEGWPHHGRTFSICPCPLSFRLTLPRSPVHVLMLSIQAVRGLPRLRVPGIVPCIISFSRQLPFHRWLSARHLQSYSKLISNANTAVTCVPTRPAKQALVSLCRMRMSPKRSEIELYISYIFIFTK